jgi:uncharacterized membrane protein
MKNYFLNQISRVQNGQKVSIRFLGAGLTYLFLIFGLCYFIIIPKRNIKDAFLFGIVIYGVYESTNYAIFRDWSFLTVIIDTLWGGILFALTTYVIRLISG